MFCTYCGKQLPDDSRFCRFCGKQLIEGNNQAAVPPIVPKQAGFFRKYGKIVLCCAGALLVIIGVLAAMAAGNGRPSGNPENHSIDYTSGQREESESVNDVASEPETNTPLPVLSSSAVDVPDPALYFAELEPKQAKLSRDGTNYMVSVTFPAEISSDKLDAVLADYMDLLENYGFEKAGEEEEDESLLTFYKGAEVTHTVASFGYSEEPASVVLVYHQVARILMVNYSIALYTDNSTPKADLGFLAENKEPASAPTPEPEENPKDSSGKVDSANIQIPDFGAFSGIDLEPAEEKIFNTSTQKDYFFKTNEKVVEEYIKLLTEKYNFQVREDSENVVRTVILDYNGTGSISFFDTRKQKDVSVYLWIFHVPSTEFHVTYGDGLEYVDNGDRTTQAVKRDDETGSSDSSSTSSSGSGSRHEAYVPEYSKPDCLTCKGTGECTNCNGYGYLYSRASDKRDRNCLKCLTTGKCQTCGGTGKR